MVSMLLHEGQTWRMLVGGMDAGWVRGLRGLQRSILSYDRCISKRSGLAGTIQLDRAWEWPARESDFR